MIRDLLKLHENKFDLIVIGGGINGTAIANLAASCGVKIALLDKGDFSSGASSKSTKLLHGGIRYLENLEFDLVHEALKERFIQWQAVPYLVKPLAFVIPVYKNDKRPLWLMKLGVWLYDLLSGKYRIGQHRFLSVAEIIALAPGINTKDLIGGVEYFDAQMDDARICLENALMADAKGAFVANYVRVEEFLKDKDHKVIGIHARDAQNGMPIRLFAPKIIVAAGPWSDELIQMDEPKAPKQLRLTKGVHLVYQGEISSHAFLLQSRQDKRIFFVIPFKGNTLIGTTDTDYDQSPDAMTVAPEDINYLLQEASRVFPHIHFDHSKIINSFVGLRPLVAEIGDPSKISRRHHIEKHPSGIYYVMGGKYTTYRAIAEKTLLKAMPELAAKMPYAQQYSLYGSGGSNEEHKIISMRYEVPLEVVRYLQGIYGSRFINVLNLTQTDSKLKEKICTCSPTIAAQVIYARDVEMAREVEDIWERRLGLSYLACPSGDCKRYIKAAILDLP